MSIEELFVPFGVFALIVSFLVKLLLLQHQKLIDARFDELQKKRDAQDDTIGDIGDTLGDHGNRIGQLEAVMRFLPSHSDMTEVKAQLAKLSADNEGQTALLEKLDRQVERVNNWLIDRAK